LTRTVIIKIRQERWMVERLISLLDLRWMVGEFISLIDLRWMVGEFISLTDLRWMVGEFISLIDLRWMVGEFISLIDLSFKVIPLKLFLNIVPSSSPDNVTTLVARMFSWMLLSLLRLQNMRHRVGYFQTALRFQNRRRRKSHLTNKTFMENQLFLFSSNLIKVVL